MKGLFGVGRTRSADDAQVRIGTFENDASGDFAGRVYVALEGDWLRTLQDKIEKETAKNLPKHTFNAVFYLIRKQMV